MKLCWSPQLYLGISHFLRVPFCTFYWFLFDYLIFSPDVERGQVVKAFVVLSDRFSEVSTSSRVRLFLIRALFIGAWWSSQRERSHQGIAGAGHAYHTDAQILFTGACESNNSTIQVPSKDWVCYQPAQDCQWQDTEDRVETQGDNWNPCLASYLQLLK